MNPKEFKQIVSQYGEYYQHADAADARLRRHVEQQPDHPIVLIKLHAQPHSCEDCGRDVKDRKVRSHIKKPAGWRTHCNQCNRTRQPGSEVFGQTTGVKAAERGVSVAIQDEEPQLEPILPLPQECQSTTTETAASVDPEPEFVEQVIVRECHEFLIREFVRIPVESLPESSDVPGPDNAVHKD